MSNDELITTVQAEKLSNPPVTRIFLRRLCNQGVIKGARKIGRDWTFTRAAFDEWQASRKPKGRPKQRES